MVDEGEDDVILLLNHILLFLLFFPWTIETIASCKRPYLSTGPYDCFEHEQ